MTVERFVVTPLWSMAGEGHLENFESRVSIAPGDLELLRNWAQPRSVDEVARATGRDPDAVAAAAAQFLNGGVLVPELAVRYALPAIEIEITAACQADCTFCPREAIRRSRGFAHMSREVFGRLVDNLTGRGVPGYCFCGIGEPTLHPHWFEFAETLRRRDPQAALHCYSNGWDLEGETGDLLSRSPIDVLMISVHSFDREVRNRLMRLAEKDDILRRIETFLDRLRVAGSTLEVRIGQVELPGLPRDLRLADWCAARGVRFESWANWNRAGNVSIDDSRAHWTNISPDSCYHYASTVFVDHRGRVLSCCCDAKSETSELSACISPLEDIVRSRLQHLASGVPLTHLCTGCDSSLSNRPFLGTQYYQLALKQS